MSTRPTRTAEPSRDTSPTLPRSHELLGLLAATAVVVYVTTTIIGGLLDPGYSHVSMHVSELTSSHAPNRVLLAVLYTGYNIALGGMGLALLRTVRWSRWLPIASWSLIASAVAGVLLVTWFPQDSYGYPATTAGVTHIVLAGVAALLFIVAVVSAGRAFRADPQWAGLARVSTLAAVAVVATGLVGAIGAAAASPFMGLLQRLNIGTIMLWLAVVSWYGFRHRATDLHFAVTPETSRPAIR